MTAKKIKKIEYKKSHKCKIGEPHPIFYHTKILFCYECYQNNFKQCLSPPASPVTSPRKLIN